MPQLINTLSNQDFPGLEKTRLRESLGKMKEMRVQLLMINRNNSESSIGDFLSSPFFCNANRKHITGWRRKCPTDAVKKRVFAGK